MQGTVLGSDDTAVNKTEMPTLVELPFDRGRMENKQMNRQGLTGRKEK